MTRIYRHPRRGRPRRQDWRLGPALADETPGTPVMAKVTYTNQRVRATFMGVDLEDRYIFEADDGEKSYVWPHQVEYWRAIENVYQPGDLVLLRGVPESEWRGFVVEVHDELVTCHVGADEHAEDVPAAQLEPASSRPQPSPPRIKPGPPANSSALEELNQDAYDRMVGRDRITE